MTSYQPARLFPGLASKVWPEPNLGLGVILHSMEGYMPYARTELADPAVQLSWHFSVRQDGVVEQHYPLEASPWHAGSHVQNNHLIGVEHEGLQTQPLTPAQLQASCELVRWIGQQRGWLGSRDVRTRTLWEHREVSSTTCPNGRINWPAYLEELYMGADIRTVDVGLIRLKLEAAAQARLQAERLESEAHVLAGGDGVLIRA